VFNDLFFNDSKKHLDLTADGSAAAAKNSADVGLP